MSVYESKTNKKANLFQLFLNIFFIGIVLITIIPLLNVLSVSLSSKSAIATGEVGIFPVGFNLDAYAKVFSNASFMRSFFYSILLTAGHTLLAMFLTILAAYPLSKKELPGRALLMGLIVVTMYFDPGIIPHYLNIKSLNLLDTVWAIAIPGALSAYNLVILRTFFSGIDNSLYEAAYMDGCSELKSMINIAIPLAKPSIATLSLFYAVNRWNGVSDVMYYINNSNLQTVQLRLKQLMDSIVISQQEIVDAAIQLTPENIKNASIVFSMVPMLIAYPFIQRFFTKGMMVGAVKG
ncbi:protein LplC [Anaerocolumna cellulosilytica]|uniref:Protein LplC n=1 Tax=Anaerocolumna cellulosilytica TaxID=433286 RepID=A0A6S6R3S5_9FIRM|nr:carbohydrate ABC transporter permease [Anaerocolumna cellulosilytica]MBB5195293.1 putative aldouronate transport system permease protein [Anaerocolumna cellulosilytica]BCJ96766.1 protein LplC [Anaerocolumna cellulosilytica]